MRVVVAIAAGLALCGCTASPNGAESTLYRNSSLNRSIRVHFATFDAGSRPEPNRQNCEMAARLLNANINRLNDGRPTGIGFWCEAGLYAEDGPVPANFSAAFPTDTE